MRRHLLSALREGSQFTRAKLPSLGAVTLFAPRRLLVLHSTVSAVAVMYSFPFFISVRSVCGIVCLLSSCVATSVIRNDL